MEDKRSQALKRCGWVKMSNPLYVDYHDREWGRPLHDERALFELFCLETYQAGLSWETVLNKRSAFRKAFSDYEIEKVAAMTDVQLEKILQNPEVIRNRQKIFATRANAQAFLEIQKKFGSFDHYIWSFVENKTIHNKISDYQEAPAKTPLSEKIAKELKKQGCAFVGPVAVYSFLQAAGLVNDHEQSCTFNPIH
ncbi:DNA-3-methyladenine glycosylase I [Streptococcus sp. H49]|uniref:DNA-3-methyladenine glycosylase I n=1 Tax=Streptococcus huangxiaojuni TaxID=3237239 RepID=UPI0034A2D6B5